MASRRNRRVTVDQDLTDNEDGNETEADDQEFQARTESNGRTNSQDWTQTQQGRRALAQREHLGAAAMKKLVGDVIKMALHCAHRRQPLRKDEINKHVLKKNAAVWPAVYQDVQSRLRTRFGMELVELRTRAEAELIISRDTRPTETVTETQEPGQSKGKKRANAAENGQEPPAKKKASSGTKSWAVRSSLGHELISLLNEPKELLMENINGEGQGTDERDCGAILDWSGGDGISGGGVALKGILLTILALILVRDRAIMDTVFLKVLSDKLNLNPQTVLPFSAKAALSGSLRFDEYLAILTKQGYLQKIRILSAMGAAGNGQDAAQYEWRWGSRADAEIGEQAVCEFMLDIAGNPTISDHDGDVRRRRSVATGNPGERKEMKAAIAKAAGSILLDVTPA